jgi:TolA-binding protein
MIAKDAIRRWTLPRLIPLVAAAALGVSFVPAHVARCEDKTSESKKSDAARADEPKADDKKSDEKTTADASSDQASREQIDAEKAKARTRMRQDSRKYSEDELRDAEQLYQVANKSWRSPEAWQNLEALVKKYPKFNRTGCAVLYLGQYSKGEQREKYLKQAIDDFSDCFYGDGVQVGAYARYLLAMHYKDTKNPDKAAELLKELIKKYPKSVTHGGDQLAKIANDDLETLAPAPAK